jgi:hypothetical protein
MKQLRFAPRALLLFSSVSSLASAQTRATPPATQSQAQVSFALLKSLAGRWKGMTHIAVPAPDSFPVEVSLRVTSGGDALMHEMTPEGRADDPTHGDDDPITMLYVDGKRLMLTHYCDVGKNRPRMIARSKPGTKTVEFDFLDLSGETRRGHMHHATFTFVDADHHIEDWTYEKPNGARARAHIELTRVK